MSDYRRPDFLLVTPLEEERDAVLNLLDWAVRLPPDDRDVRVYYWAELPTEFPDGSTGVYRLVIVSPLGMGRVEAANATSDAIHRFKPRYVLIVGIAGGISEKVALGDILVADQFVDYELQKLSDVHSQVRYQAHRADPRLLNASQHLRNWHEWVSLDRPGEGKPRRHIGPVISGDKVIASREALQKYLDDWPKLVGVEMEAGGVASAAFQAASAPGVLMIRGVSDTADAHKNSAEVTRWREYACAVAASYMMCLLCNGPVPLSQSVVAKKPEPTLADKLNFSDAARRIFAEQSPGWCYLLFQQLLVDEVDQLADLYGEFVAGVIPNSAGFLAIEPFMEKVRHGIAEYCELRDNLDKLVQAIYPTTLKYSGTPQEVKSIANIARKIADIYRASLNWNSQWNGIMVDNKCSSLARISAVLGNGIIAAIRNTTIDIAHNLQSGNMIACINFALFFDYSASEEIVRIVADEHNQLVDRLARERRERSES